MPRVMFVTTVAASDGASRALGALVHALPPPWDVAVVSLTSVTPAFARWIDSDRLALVELGARGLFDVRAFRRLLACLRAWPPDIVHTSLSRGDWWGRTAGRATGVPAIISTIQNRHRAMYAAEFDPLRARGGLLADRLTRRLAHRFVAVSAGVRDDLAEAGIAPSRIAVIPNAIDLRRLEEARPRAEVRREWEVDDDDVVVGTSALLKAQKGLENLVDAAGILGRRGRRATFLVFGDGPLREALVRRAATAVPAGCQVRFAGWVEDVARLLPGLDVFALPSRWEGLPVALLEAMAAGLPAVATRVSGTEDVILDGATGRLTECTAASLADAIEGYIADAPLRRRTGAAAAADVVARFNPGLCAAAHVRLYESVLGECGRRGGPEGPPHTA